jgi:hypothetical protein
MQAWTGFGFLGEDISAGTRIAALSRGTARKYEELGGRSSSSLRAWVRCDDVWTTTVPGRKWAKRRLCRSQSGACTKAEGDLQQAKQLLIEQPKKTLSTGEPTMRACLALPMGAECGWGF